jgi:hypothetical protein
MVTGAIAEETGKFYKQVHEWVTQGKLSENDAMVMVNQAEK